MKSAATNYERNRELLRQRICKLCSARRRSPDFTAEAMACGDVLLAAHPARGRALPQCEIRRLANRACYETKRIYAPIPDPVRTRLTAVETLRENAAPNPHAEAELKDAILKVFASLEGIPITDREALAGETALKYPEDDCMLSVSCGKLKVSLSRVRNLISSVLSLQIAPAAWRQRVKRARDEADRVVSRELVGVVCAFAVIVLALSAGRDLETAGPIVVGIASQCDVDHVDPVLLAGQRDRHDGQRDRQGSDQGELLAGQRDRNDGQRDYAGEILLAGQRDRTDGQRDRFGGQRDEMA